eukprot:g3922.t1
MDPEHQDATGYYDQLNVDECAQRCKGERSAWCKSFGYYPIGFPLGDGTPITSAVCFLYAMATPFWTRAGANNIHCGRREWGSVVQAVNAVNAVSYQNDTQRWLLFPNSDPNASYVQANGNNADSPGTGSLVFHVRVSPGVTRLTLAGTFGYTGGSLLMVYVQPASPITTYIHGFGARAPSEAGALTAWKTPSFSRTKGVIAANFTTGRTIAVLWRDQVVPTYHLVPSYVKLLTLANANSQGLQVGRLKLIATGGEAVFLIE